MFSYIILYNLVILYWWLFNGATIIPAATERHNKFTEPKIVSSLSVFTFANEFRSLLSVFTFVIEFSSSLQHYIYKIALVHSILYLEAVRRVLWIFIETRQWNKTTARHVYVIVVNGSYRHYHSGKPRFTVQKLYAKCARTENPLDLLINLSFALCYDGLCFFVYIHCLVSVNTL